MILVSECLLGGRIVRYDGKGCALVDPAFLAWAREGRLVPVCPEVCGGLPVPRIEAQRVGCRVLDRTGRDVTAEYEKGAQEAVRLAKMFDVAFAVLKQGSPSCGSRRIHDGAFSGRMIDGQGLAAERLRSEGFLVFGDDELEAARALLMSLPG
jgi:uncharacterized protein YbbK (DUF523 family)